MKNVTSNKTIASFWTAIAVTTLVAGTLDMIGAIISYTANGGKNPTVIFQYIASALLGKSAYGGGTGVIIIGVLLHYLIAFIFTLFFFIIFPKIKMLPSNTLIIAIVYGIFVWFVMNRIVIPYFTKLDPVTFDIKKASIAAFILILCIGFPVVTAAKKYYNQNFSR